MILGPTIMTRLAGPRCLKTSPDYVGVLARFLPHAPQACRWLAAARIDPLRQRCSRQLRGHNERPPNLPLNSPAKPSHRHEIPIWPDIARGRWPAAAHAGRERRYAHRAARVSVRPSINGWETRTWPTMTSAGKT